MLPPNAVRIARGMYIVRTQAGFRKALKCECDDSHVRKKVFTYPRSYPALVSITIGYGGYEYMSVNWVPLDKVKAAMLEQGELFNLTQPETPTP